MIEKKDVLGGLAHEISKIPDKNRLADFPNYLINRASKLNNLFVFKNREADIKFIDSLNPNIIVNATGSNPLLPPIKGLKEAMEKENSKVASIKEMIENIPNYPEDMTGKKVVVIGGGAVGLDVVEFFAPRNAKISIVEMQPVIGKDLDPVTKVQTSTLIEKYDVLELTNTALLEVKDNLFIVRRDGKEEELEFDYGFVCLGMRANAPVLESLRENFDSSKVEIVNIGDSVRARRIIEGVQEGRNILNTLRKRNYL